MTKTELEKTKQTNDKSLKQQSGAFMAEMNEMENKLLSRGQKTLTDIDGTSCTIQGQ